MVKVIEIRLKQILKERNMDQKQLAEMTGLTTRTISEICTQKTQRYPKRAIELICDALKINDANELFHLHDVSEK
jgi:putative transcriptional regulator